MSERTEAIVLYFTLFSTFISLCTILLGLVFKESAWIAPDWKDFGILALAGILGGLGQILVTTSYSYADASVIAPFEYTTMIWALLLGYFMFGDAPTLSVVLGGLIVASTGIFIVWRERQISRAQRAKTKSGGQS